MTSDWFELLLVGHKHTNKNLITNHDKTLKYKKTENIYYYHSEEEIIWRAKKNRIKRNKCFLDFYKHLFFVARIVFGM
jgi:hypothetical protein